MNIIIGSGPAGISAAYHLKQKGLPFLIIDKENKIGGLCRSFELAGATFDIGGHAFFTKHEYINDLIDKCAPEELYKQPRSAWVYSYDTYIPYPFQANLYGLPAAVVKECLLGLIDNIKTKPADSPKNIKEWISQSFGPGISKHFMTPYNEKIWAHPLDTVTPNWASDRIVEPNYESIIAGALQRNIYKDYPNAMVRYPSDGGYEKIVEYLARDLELDKHLIKGELISVDTKNKKIFLRDGQSLKFNNLISTVPLTQLSSMTKMIPERLLKESKKLKAFSLYLVNLVTKRKPDSTEMQRVYCSNPEVPFHKLVLNANSSKKFKEEPYFTYQAEVSYSDHKKVDKSTLEKRVIDSLKQMKLLDDNDPILASSIVDVPLAYPVYTKDWESSRTLLIDYFNSHQIYCAGRFGEWLYINADTAIMRGKEAAEKILQHYNQHEGAA